MGQGRELGVWDEFNYESIAIVLRGVGRRNRCEEISGRRFCGVDVRYASAVDEQNISATGKHELLRSESRI